VWLAHSALDVEGADVLPVLLKEGNQEVDGHLDVDDNLVFSEADVSYGNTEAENLLELELDSALDLGNLFLEGLSVGDEGWELASLVKTWTQETRDLTKNDFGGKEGVVLASELLDDLLVLVHLLEGFNILVVKTGLGGSINVDLISKNAELHSWLAFVWQLDSA